MNWRKNTHIFVKLLNIKWIFIIILSSIERTECQSLNELNSKQFEGISKNEDLYDRANIGLNAEPDAANGDDADVFVAEIFTEQPTTFEQLFRPLARYKKAVLGMDAQIEPVGKYSEQIHSMRSEVEPVLQQSDPLLNIYKIEAPQSSKNIQFYDNKTILHNKELYKYEESEQKYPINYRKNNGISKEFDKVIETTDRTTKNKQQQSQAKDNQLSNENEADSTESGSGENDMNRSHSTDKINSIIHEMKTSSKNHGGLNDEINAFQNVGGKSYNTDSSDNQSSSRTSNEKPLNTSTKIQIEKSNLEEMHSSIENSETEKQKSPSSPIVTDGETKVEEIRKIEKNNNTNEMINQRVTNDNYDYNRAKSNHENKDDDVGKERKKDISTQNIQSLPELEMKESNDAISSSNHVLPFLTDERNKYNDTKMIKKDEYNARDGTEEDKQRTILSQKSITEKGKIFLGTAKVRHTNLNEQDNGTKEHMNSIEKEQSEASNGTKQLVTVNDKDTSNKEDHRNQKSNKINYEENEGTEYNQNMQGNSNVRMRNLNVTEGIIITGKPEIISAGKQKIIGKKMNGKVKSSRKSLKMRQDMQRGKIKNSGLKIEYNGRDHDDINFEMTLLSKKARELYRDLIHDTGKALKQRKFNKEKRRRQHASLRKTNKIHKSKIERKKKLNSEKIIIHSNETNSSSKKQTMTRLKSNEKEQNLAHQILNVMTENDNLLHQRNVSPFANMSTDLYGNQEQTTGTAITKEVDTQNTLIEKLAELRYVTDKKNIYSEEPIPSKENENNEGIINNANEDDNPGKTVMQKQKLPGLGPNVDLDRMEDKNADQMVIGDIDGELEKNENVDELHRATDIGRLIAATPNISHQMTDSQLMSKTSNVFLNEYNKEESLRNEDNTDELNNDSNNNIASSSLKSNFELENVKSKSKLLSQIDANNMDEHLNKDGKEIYDQPKSLYFVGNRSSWKNHTVVSMNIKPLVDLFYKVNHQNLFDLVERENKIRLNDAEHHNKMAWKSDTIMKNSKAKHRKNKKNRNGQEWFNELIKTEAKRLKAAMNKIQKESSLRERNSLVAFGKMTENELPPLKPEFKNNMPENVKYYQIKNAAKLGAVCIDGSIPGYYYRCGHGSGKKKWIIHLHGGAWCYNIRTCFRRSFSILGSTKHWSAENITNFFQGILSDKPETNPNFYNWNVVVQTYCDGGLFSGRRKEPVVFQGQKMYFRGRLILKALIKSLSKKKLGNASDVILSGTSAGGLAVLLQSDYMKQKLPKHAKVRGLVDAGFFLHIPGQGWPNVVEDQFKGLYEMHQPKLIQQCIKKKLDKEKYKCLFPQNSLMHSKTPIYFVNALYDHWQLSELQNLRCVYNNEQCIPEQRDKILNFRSAMFSALQEAIRRKKNAGLYADSCIAHGQVIVDYTWSRVRVNNSTIDDAFSNWLDDKNSSKDHINVDCRTPCNGSCPKQMVRSCMNNFQRTSRKYRTKRNAELC